MGLGGFFKKVGSGFVKVGKGAGKVGVFIGKNADQALPLIQLVGIPIPGVQLVKAAMLIAEAKGGKNKIETALEELLPALRAEGINVPVRKLKLAMELLLDEDTNGMEGDDQVWTFDVEAEAEELKARAGLLDEARASSDPTLAILVKAAQAAQAADEADG